MRLKLFISLAIVFVVTLTVGYVCIRFYPYIFAKRVIGKIVKVERVTNPNAIISSGTTPIPNAQIFSFAVAIRDDKGEIHTASSEDRQWAVAETGKCVEAKFFPYEPWVLDKSGTYHDARLERLYDCK